MEPATLSSSCHPATLKYAKKNYALFLFDYFILSFFSFANSPSTNTNEPNGPRLVPPLPPHTTERENGIPEVRT